MKRILTLLALVAVALMALSVTAADKYQRPRLSNESFRADVELRGEVVETIAEVTITSPTVTISAQDRNVIRVTVNANQTGYSLTGGELGQTVEVITAAGSNTLRFDDATSMSLGGNITLTEGQGDVLALRCVSADGDEWVRRYSSDN